MKLRIVGDDGARHQPNPLGSSADWRLQVTGSVETPYALNLNELLALESVNRTRGITCVSAANIVPGGGEVSFSGVAFSTLLRKAFPHHPPSADRAAITVELLSRAPGTVGPRSQRHFTHLALKDCLESQHGLLLATHLDGEPLAYRHGGPLRAVAPPHLFFYKSIKWLEEIRFLDAPLDSCRGTWEEHSGYHNRARIAHGERFEPRMRRILATRLGPGGELEDETEWVAPDRWQETFEAGYAEKNLSRLVAALLHKMFGHLPKDFRGVQFSAGEFRAKIRGTSFASADFTGARCAGCNFSLSKFTNTRFSTPGQQPADLSGCDFEGAFFNKAYLEGVSLRGANLSNATFFGPRDIEAPDRVRGLDLRGTLNLSKETAEKLAHGGAILS